MQTKKQSNTSECMECEWEDVELQPARATLQRWHRDDRVAWDAAKTKWAAEARARQQAHDEQLAEALLQCER